MDCEKFESAMMDELYGELDEVTSAAVKRHVAGCARCAALIEGLRATRRVAAVPPVELPPGLEDKILAATREAGKVVPLRRRVARGISLAGSWAMRPQTAMAAVFLVMIGTSVLLLRGKSSRAPASSDVIVTEQGSPAPEPVASATTAMPMAPAASYAVGAAVGSVAVARSEPARDEAAPARPPVAHATPPPSPLAQGLAPKDDSDGIADSVSGFAGPAPTTASQSALGGAGGADMTRNATAKKSTSAFDTAVQSFQSGRYAEAQKAFEALAPSDPNAELWAARSVREGQGCRAALVRFDKVARRAAGGPVGWDALLEGALCYRAIGDFNNARSRLTALLGVDSHKDRAQAELDRINQMQQGHGGGGGVSAPAARAAPAPAAPAPPPAKPPATAVDQSY
ncbi:MAG TPA: zf-HC2 domain-containing protein [Polyangiaceae bacterium]|nr:zf-HC2 domain-containing protein [Polyangiaceae bacterium]